MLCTMWRSSNADPRNPEDFCTRLAWFSAGLVFYPVVSLVQIMTRLLENIFPGAGSHKEGKVEPASGRCVQKRRLTDREKIIQ